MWLIITNVNQDKDFLEWLVEFHAMRKRKEKREFQLKIINVKLP